MKSNSYFKKLFLVAVTTGFGISTSAFADTLGSWLIPGSSTAATVNSSFSSPNTEISTLGFTGTPTSSSSGWGGTGFSTSTNISASASKNFNFYVKAQPGYQVVINGVSNFSFISSPQGPTTWTLFYSSTSDFASATQIASITGAGNTTKNITLDLTTALTASPIIVRSGKTGFFRLVGTAAVTASGTGRIPASTTVSVLGTIAFAPVPSLVWGGGEIGVWDYTTTNWLDGSTPTAFSSGALATISSPSSITVEASGVTAAVLTNSIDSGATTIGGGLLDVPTLVKTGAGTLNISNTFTNITTVQLNAGRLALWGGRTNNLGGGSSITGMPNLTMAAGTTFDLGDTDQYVANFNGAGTVVMTNVTSSGAPVNDFKVTCTTPSTFSGSITGVGIFRLCGGVFTNLGDNTYTGGTWISNGATMYLGLENALPAQTKDNPLTTTNAPGTAVDLRISSGGGTLAMSDLNQYSLVLNRSIGDTASDGQIRLQASSFPNATLELSGSIYTERPVYITNSSSSAGSVILSGSNTFQTISTNGTTGIITTNNAELRITINGRLLFKSQQNISGAALKVTDPSSSLGLAGDVINEVAVTNSLAISNYADIANFNVGLGASQALRWNGPINGPGSLYLTNKGTLILGATNSYQGGTLLMNGGTLLVSAQSQLPATTNQLGRGGDVRFSTNSGNFGLDDSVGPINLVLTNSFYFEKTGGFMAGTNTNVSTLTLAGSFYGTNAAYGAEVTNSFANVGKLILTGMNTNFVGSLRVGARGRVYVLSQTNLPAQLSFSDTSGSARFGLAEASPDDVTITNAISTGVNNTSIIATFNPGTNLTTTANKSLHLAGVISGPGRVRVAEGGDLCLDNAGNTYTNLTRIGTGRILLGSDGALGGASTNGSYGGIRFETISSSYLVVTNDVTLNVSRTLFIQSNNTANLDSQGYKLTVLGAVQDEVLDQPGSVNKLGLGEVVLSGSLAYSGNTTVSAGKLTLNQINPRNQNSTVSIAAGAILNLNFNGSQRVSKLYINGDQQNAGTYNSTTSLSIIGTGVLDVTSGPPETNMAPVIGTDQEFSVDENVPSGTVVGTVLATDRENNTLSDWKIVSGNTGNLFEIVGTGQIKVVGVLNYEGTASYNLGVTVSDGTLTSAETVLTIKVKNVPEYSDLFGNADPTGDANGDGYSNLLAYALGATNPNAPVNQPIVIVGPDNLTISAIVRINDPKCDVKAEAGTTLASWDTLHPIDGVPAEDQAGATPGVTQRKTFSVLRGSYDKKFMHLKATLNP